MNRGVLDLIDTVELAVSRATGCAPRDVIGEAHRRIDGLRSRKGHFGEILVVALAGGTGSGKSSLLNAVAGEDVAGVSVLRPHTQTPLAWIPRGHSEGVERLLDDLDITQRVEQTTLPTVALVDLPDIDSIADWHKQMVEGLIPHVDAVLWIVDPEKYHDDGLHRQFLTPLADFEEQFTFVLNKVDRLAAEDVEVVKEDLVSLLRQDGFKQPLVFTLAADPPSGEPQGIQDLILYLSEQVDVKRVAMGKAINDIATVLYELGQSARVLAGGSVDFEERWASARDTSAIELTPQSGPAARDDAICRLEDLVAALAVEVGPTLGADIRDEFPSARIERAVDAALSPAEQSSTRRLDSAIGELLRNALWRRAQFAATLASGVVATHQLRNRHLRPS